VTVVNRVRLVKGSERSLDAVASVEGVNRARSGLLGERATVAATWVGEVACLGHPPMLVVQATRWYS
jgi:hypothetical protein